MEEGRCEWYGGIDDAICRKRSGAARLPKVRYTGAIQKSRVSRCFSETLECVGPRVATCKSRFRVKSLHLLVALFDLFARPRSPTPRSLPDTLLTITLLPVSNLAEATRTNYMHLVVLYSIYPQYGTLLAIVVMVSVKFLPSAEPLER